MSTSIVPTASHKSIHLLRALLREASYLPDAVARQYFHRYVLDRFRAYQPRQNATTTAASEAIDKYHRRSFKRRELGIITARTTKMQRKARKGLHYLQRANQGELPCLQKVMFFAYGRIGRRKYALLDHVLRPDPVMDGGKVLAPDDLKAPSPLQELYHSNMQCLRYFDAPKSASEGMYHNIWMRPMPLVRARNNVRRWYAETMTRLLPPLPTDEWNHINAMMRGSEKIGLVRRRKAVQTSHPESPAESQDPLDVILDGLRLEKVSKAEKPAGAFRPHNITPKFMRRLYSRILQLCCKVEYDEERKHWVPTWGQSIKPIKPSIYNAPSDEALFAGVNSKGQIPRTGKKPKPPTVPDLQPRNDKGEYQRFPFFTEFLPEDNPMRVELETWKKKRFIAGIIDEDGTFLGRQ
ncbi:hypothetical protein DE146DRAFT_681116 [Phaeosphaeria sp. MPI-PUGE-AT-0046c]|nr:hypothetical protein DE146DRAFT_681116 [Phaeosphaeria sp. MPI-PUGE-AT-0046c]